METQPDLFTTTAMQELPQVQTQMFELYVAFYWERAKKKSFEDGKDYLVLQTPFPDADTKERMGAVMKAIADEGKYSHVIPIYIKPLGTV